MTARIATQCTAAAAVSARLQDHDLSPNALFVAGSYNARLLKYLDGHRLPRQAVGAEANLSEGAFADSLTQNIPADYLRSLRRSRWLVPLRWSVGYGLCRWMAGVRRAPCRGRGAPDREPRARRGARRGMPDPRYAIANWTLVSCAAPQVSVSSFPRALATCIAR